MEVQRVLPEATPLAARRRALVGRRLRVAHDYFCSVSRRILLPHPRHDCSAPSGTTNREPLTVRLSHRCVARLLAWDIFYWRRVIFHLHRSSNIP